MSQLQFFEAIVVDPAPDPSMPGFISVRIPSLFGDEELPHLVGPIHPGWVGGGWHSTPSAVLPEGVTDETDVRVIVVRLAKETFRWIGTTQGFAHVEDAPGSRAGASSPNGRHRIIIGDDEGLQIVVSLDDNPLGPKNFVSVAPNGIISVGTASGSVISVQDGTVAIQNSAGDSIIVDETNGIALVHNGGADLITVGNGEVKIIGGDVLVLGGAVSIVGQGGVKLGKDPTGVAPSEELLMSRTFLTDLATSLTELAGVLALGVPVTQTLAMIGKIATSLGAGAPYLSTTSKTEG